MSIDRARAYLKTWNMDGKIQEFDGSSATVELAAQALGCAAERIAKTLSFETEGGCFLVVAAGDAKIDNAKFKGRFHRKAKMLPPESVEALIGHAVGGVCPFGIEPGVPVYLDQSMQRFATVYPACGSSNSAIELTLKELETLCQSIEWVDVCKGWDGGEPVQE